ncbi:hypothetical protein [Schlesneria paludicola]|uniref:hypothetical protein n=1 Tax=Schlesneria paludicola TaxID=360056 RepID=UPI0012FA6EB5|nr:hypothetical protein [Schlesneria paludicola]
MDSIDSANSLESAKVLHECCERGTSCRFKLIHNGYVAPARFLTLNGSNVRLQLSVEHDDEPLPEQAIACISFSYQSKFCAILGCVIEVGPLVAEYQSVTISIPKQVLTTNLRQSFRVPVVPDAGLETRILLPNQQWLPVQARDLADSGIEVELTAADWPELTVGTAVAIELRFRGETLEKPGEVRRINASGFGIAFDDVGSECEAPRDAQLARMTLVLQQLWLKNRTK